MALLSSPLGAQSVLNFPRVVSGEESFTGIAVGNPTTRPAVVTFHAFTPEGTLANGPGVQNPVTKTIVAGGQVARQYDELFGDSASGARLVFDGWVQASSPVTGLTGFYLNADDALSDADGALAAEPTVDAVIPFASGAGDAVTEVTVLNPNAEPTAASVVLYRADGSVAASRIANLTGRALVRWTTAEIVADESNEDVAFLRVMADRPVVAHAVVTGFRIGDGGPLRESVAVPGRPLGPDPSHVLPQFASGGGWTSFFGVVNGAGTPQTISLTAWNDDGTVVDSPANPRSLILGPNATFRGTVADIFELGPGPSIRTGWISVAGEVGNLASYIAFGNDQSPSFALVEGASRSEASGRQVFSQVAEGAGFFTGLTVVNPGDAPASVRFTTLLPDGSTVGVETMTLGPRERFGRLYRELLPASLGQVGGWALVTSDRALVGAVLFGSTNGMALANVPAEPVVVDFLPPGQQFAAITGTVRQNGSGVSGIAVRLDGPVRDVRTSDADGRFVFPRLPPGAYTATATGVGLTFDPSSRTVTVADVNRNAQDFAIAGVHAALPPEVASTSPATAFAGEDIVGLTVLGENFNPASVVVFDGVVLPTAFVDANRLQAVVPGSLVEAPRTASITVTTPPPGGGASVAVEFPVLREPEDPLVVGRVGVGAFPAGVAIHHARAIAVVSNESSDTVSIIDLGGLEVIGTVAVGRSPGEGIVVDEALDLALVANVGDRTVSVIDLGSATEVSTIPVGSFPTGLALDPGTHIAAVSNAGDDTVSIIDVRARQVVGTVAVGAFPGGVAINPTTGRAVVANRRSDSISLIDLAARSVIGELGVGRFPRAVAIDEVDNTAVVAEASGNSAALVDLDSFVVTGTVGVGIGPSGAAIDSAAGQAIVTNSAVGAGSSELTGQGSVSVIDVDSQRVIETVPAGTATFGVDIQTSTRRAVVANFAGNDVTVIQLPHPVPYVESVAPDVFSVGGEPFTFTVFGRGFLPTSVVTLNGDHLPTRFADPSALAATVPGDLIVSLLQVDRDTSNVPEPEFVVGVTNPRLGGGPSPPPGSRIFPENRVPMLYSLSDTAAESGASPIALTLLGNNFNRTSVVNFGSRAYRPVRSTLTTLTVVIPLAMLEPGVYPVSVSNPPPGGGTSRALSFEVSDLSFPTPRVTGISPPSVATGSPSVRVTISGSGFVPETTVSLGGVTLAADVGPQIIEFTVPGELVDAPGSLSGLVANPLPGGGSAPFVLNVVHPVPDVRGFDPSAVLAGGGPWTIRVTGADFAPNAVVLVGPTPLATVFESSSAVSALIPDAVIAESGRYEVGVRNPAPGGGYDAGGDLVVSNAIPAIDRLDPATLPSGAPPTRILVSGSGFIPNSVVALDGIVVPSEPIDRTRVAFVTPEDLGDKVYIVTVTNPAPGGGVSNGAGLSVGSIDPVIPAPEPVLNGLSPAGGEVDAGDLVTVLGDGFLATTVFRIDGVEIGVTFRDRTSARMIFPDLVDGIHVMSAMNLPTSAGGGGTATFTFATGGGSERNPFGVAPAMPGIFPGGTQQFALSDPPAGGVRWLVNGIVSGNATFGTITGDGFYSAPNTIPDPSSFTVCARGLVTSIDSCVTVTVRQIPTPGGDLVVFNDVQAFEVPQLEVPVGVPLRQNNRLLVTNLVSFATPSPRGSGTVVQIDCGHQSERGCDRTAALGAIIGQAGLQVVQTFSPTGGLGTTTPIDPRARVLFLWAPTTRYTNQEINALKQFASQGGRIVVNGGARWDGTWKPPIDTGLLDRLGSGMRVVGGPVAPAIGPASITAHQVTTGLNAFGFVATGVMVIGPNDLPLLADGSGVYAAVTKVDVTPVLTTP